MEQNIYYAKELVQLLQKSEKIVIYGARIVASEVANCLMGAPYYFHIDAFMVSCKIHNPSNIMGIPVVELQEGKRIYRDAMVVIAVLEKYQSEIEDTLCREGFEKTVALTFESDLWSDIRGNYVKQLLEREGRKYYVLEEELKKISMKTEKKDSLKVYMVKSHVDKKPVREVSVPHWEVPIQAGAALTDCRIAEVCDNTGDNISIKNKEYCELTALYWIWKNDRSTYVGLCHYRRHFIMDVLDSAKLEDSDIDVVLTIPVLNFPNVRSMYAHDHEERDWAVMLEALEKLAPEYCGAADRLQKGVFYYAYNMLITRREILESYCSWLFPILKYCEERCEKKENSYQNRFVGFLAERLMSIYFFHHDRDYKIVHARKRFDV